MIKKNLVKRLVVISIASALMAGSFTGCGSAPAAAASSESSAEVKEANASEIADRLLKEITYKDELSEMSLDTAEMIFDFTDIAISNAYIYETAGATAEEVVVLECADTASADKAIQALTARVKEQMESYEDYAPDEMVKLKAAYLAELNNIAVLSVSDMPEKAKEIMSSYDK